MKSPSGAEHKLSPILLGDDTILPWLSGSCGTSNNMQGVPTLASQSWRPRRRAAGVDPTFN